MQNKNFWKNVNVLITGASGLLGSEIVTQLLDKGANIITIVRDTVPKSRFFLENLNSKVTITRGDVEDYTFVERVIAEYEINTVFHLAAQPIVKIANLSPLGTFNANIKGTWNVLEASKNHMNTVKSVVVASSDKAYGTSPALPYDETAPLHGQHPYDVSKSCVDLLSQSYWFTYRLPVNITRCGNFYGPGDLNFNRIIPGTILSVMNKERPVIRSDGSYIRNYFYIKDAADGYITISENRDKVLGEAFNLGSEDRYSVLEITNLVLKVMGSKLDPIVKNEVSNEIKEQYLSIKKVKDTLNWKPKYDTEKALKETIDWYKEYVS
jgi:CDP-glucose 4,6-dehydratase